MRNGFAPKRIMGVLSALITFFSIASTAEATVMVEIPLEQMIDEAEAIIVGRVVSSGSRLVMVDGAAEVHTASRIRVETWVKGSGADTVLVDELGGRFQDTVRWASGTPEYTVGDRVLVFLTRAPEVPNGYRTLQMCQGKYVINDGIEGQTPTLVRRDTSGVSFASWATEAGGEMTLSEGGLEPAMPLQQFVDFIRSEVARGAIGTGRTL